MRGVGRLLWSLLRLVVLVPVAGVYHLWAHRRGGTGGAVAIERVSAADCDLAALMGRDRPVVIEGLGAELGEGSLPDLATMRRLAVDHGDELDVQIFDPSAPYFLYRGDYGRRLDRVEQLTLDALLDRVFTAGGAGDGAIYHQFDRHGVDGACGDILDRLGAALTVRAERTPAPDVSGIWIGSPGVVTPLHYDAWPGLLIQSEGAKQVTMFSPADADHLYLTSPFEATGPWSELPGRSADADPDRFPRLARARRHEATLRAGDTLFVPPFWAHEIEALEPNISVPLRFGIETRDQFHPRFLRPAYEQLHNSYLVRTGLRRTEQRAMGDYT